MDTSFEKIGKRMPYTVPKEFFRENEIAILARTTRRRRMNWSLICGVAASLVLVCLVTLRITSSSDSPSLYGYHDAMADEEVASWVEFYEADIFISANFNTSIE